MATISLKTTFNLAASPQVFAFEDTTDYAGQGINIADVNGCIAIYSPGNFLYYTNNDFTDPNSDINRSAGVNAQHQVLLPQSGGSVQFGLYKIIYTVYNSILDEYYTVEYEFDFDHVTPSAIITQECDCISPSFISKDATIYEKTGATYTFASRTHELHYPAGTGAVLTTTSGDTITTSIFYNGPQSTVLESYPLYEYDQGYFVADKIAANKYTTVDCTDICAIACCIKSLEVNMRNYRTTNTERFLEAEKTFTMVMAYVGLIRFAIQCGLSQHVSGYLSLIKEYANCTDDCKCSDEPIQVEGLGGGASVNVVSGGSPVVVTSTVAGGLTTYTITLSSAFITTINNLIAASAVTPPSTVVAAGANVTVTSSVAGSVTTYTVNASAAAPVTSVNLRADSITNRSITATTNQTAPDIQLTVATPGEYIAVFEGDIKNGGAGVAIFYRIIKNSTTAINTNRNMVMGPSGDVVKLYCSSPVVNLIAGDTIDISIDSDAAATLVGRSMTLRKL